MTNDVRWIQRFNNYQKALSQLSQAVALSGQRPLSDLENQGMIQAFEFTHELAWNCLKDFLEHKGQSGIYGSRDATRMAFELGLIEDGDGWMDMILSRNRTTHTYNQEVMQEIISAITTRYHDQFQALSEKLVAMAE